MGCVIVVILSMCPRKENSQDKKLKMLAIQETRTQQQHSKYWSIHFLILPHPFLIANPVPWDCSHGFDTNETPKSLEAKESG